MDETDNKKIQEANLQAIINAWNLGIYTYQYQLQHQMVSLQLATAQIYDLIYDQLNREFREKESAANILASTEFLTSVSVMAYTIARTCSYKPGLNDELFSLIMARISQHGSHAEEEGINPSMKLQ